MTKPKKLGEKNKEKVKIIHMNQKQEKLGWLGKKTQKTLNLTTLKRLDNRKSSFKKGNNKKD